MLYSASIVATLAVCVAGHGLVLSIEGANGVSMPGLSVADGTPRDCTTNRCGSQADTAIIRDREMSEVGPLGRTQGNGPVRADTMVSNFMGTGSAPTNNGADASVGVEDNINNNKRSLLPRQLKKLLGGLLGGGADSGGATGLSGLLGGGGSKTSSAAETAVATSAGVGSSKGLPTCSDSGAITMTFRQINQDGAGPLTAAVDGTSGGTDPSAFKTAEVVQDVPGLGIQGLSLATNTDFPLTVQMPAGMTCDATVGGVDNVCIVRVRNGAAAGPFGGSAAFTMSPTARKRAISYRLKRRASV